MHAGTSETEAEREGGRYLSSPRQGERKIANRHGSMNDIAFKATIYENLITSEKILITRINDSARAPMREIRGYVLQYATYPRGSARETV